MPFVAVMILHSIIATGYHHNAKNYSICYDILMGILISILK